MRPSIMNVSASIDIINGCIISSGSLLATHRQGFRQIPQSDSVGQEEVFSQVKWLRHPR